LLLEGSTLGILYGKHKYMGTVKRLIRVRVRVRVRVGVGVRARISMII
jgi:hypothetical protein